MKPFFETKTKVADQPVYVAIRPEGLVVNKEGKGPSFSAEVSQVQTLGRDLYIVAKNAALPPADLQSHHSKQR
jgi:ABC-type sugar transport system ATPase subunit